ncbi:MAG: YhbY family RNA-binding protein [Lachnospiraceae bacterium]
MTSKERAHLISIAMKYDAIINIGKGGITPEITANVDEALEARELIKVNVQKNCFDPIRDLAETIAGRTRSEVVQVIGRKFVLYRYSKTKTKHIEF